jgi:hypothetical protein
MDILFQSTNSTLLPSQLVTPLHSSLLQRIETIRDGVFVDETLVCVTNGPLSPQNLVPLLSFIFT